MLYTMQGAVQGALPGWVIGSENEGQDYQAQRPGASKFEPHPEPVASEDGSQSHEKWEQEDWVVLQAVRQ